MTTKRSTAANGGKNTAAVSLQPKPKPELNAAQEFVVDEVSQLLLHGGRKEDLDGLLMVALNSALWRVVNGHSRGPEKLADLAKLAAPYLPDYRASIVGEWARNKQAPAAEQPEPKSVSDRVRADILDHVRSGMEEFIVDGTPEEHWLMVSILEWWSNINLLRPDLRPQVSLAEAFSNQIGAQACYVRVSDGDREEVVSYVRSLEASRAA